MRLRRAVSVSFKSGGMAGPEYEDEAVCILDVEFVESCELFCTGGVRDFEL